MAFQCFHDSCDPLANNLTKLQPNNANCCGRSQPNILRLMTIGLSQLTIEITATSRLLKSNFRFQRTSLSFTKEDGSLVDVSQLPVLIKRYNVSAIIGEGTFSQIFSATDSLGGSRSTVAIKVLRRSFSILGSRECLFLRTLATSCGRRGGLSHCEWQ